MGIGLGIGVWVGVGVGVGVGLGSPRAAGGSVAPRSDAAMRSYPGLSSHLVRVMERARARIRVIVGDF